MVAGIKRLWQSKQGVQSAAGLLAMTMLMSNILGFARDVVLANTIPLTVLDSYYAAFRLPDFLFNLFILGAISSAFIPVFLKLQHAQGDGPAWRLANNLISSALVVLVVLGVILFAAMPSILPLFVPGFEGAKLDQTVALARILIFSPLFFAGSYVVGGILNAHKRFFAYAMAPLVYNLAIIVGGLLAPYFGVESVAVMVVVGAALHLGVQLPVARELSYRFRFAVDWRDASLRRVIRLMIPRSLSLGMQQVVLMVLTAIGSLLPKGAVSIYALTNNFQTTPVAIFASSIATAVFPHLGATTSRRDDADYRAVLTGSLRGMVYLIIPSMVLMWIFRAHIIRLYLALNHQTWEDTIRAISTLEWFIFALLAQGFNLIMVRAFYARQDTYRPMVLSIIGGATVILTALWQAPRLGDVEALSLAFFVGVSVEAILLATVFGRTYRGLVDYIAVVKSAFVAGIFSLISGAVVVVTIRLISDGLPGWWIGIGTSRVVSLASALIVGAGVWVGLFLGLSKMFQRGELDWVWPKRALSEAPMADSESVAKGEGFSS